MQTAGLRLIDSYKFYPAFGPAVPNSASPPYVRLDGYAGLTIVLVSVNGSSGITASTVGLLQAQDATGTNAKALSINYYSQIADTNPSTAPPGDQPTAVVNGGTTVALPAVGSKTTMTIISIRANDLDVNNSFTSVALTLSNAVAQTVFALYIAQPGVYQGNYAQMPTILS